MIDERQIERIRVPDLRAYLSGFWQIDRVFLDRHRSIRGTMAGQAHFAEDGDSLKYSERGSLSFGDHEGEAEQHLGVEFTEGAARASVCFRDGRPFYSLDLSEGWSVVSHVCGADRYEGRFFAFNHLHWQSTWEVSGPRKNLQIVTQYARRSGQKLAEAA